MGVILEQNLGWNIEVGTLFANLHNIIYNIKLISKYLDFTTRKQFIYAIVIGELQHILPLYTNIMNSDIIKLHSKIIGSYCFKKSIRYILNKTNLFDTKDFISYCSIKFLFKIIKYKIPQSIYELFIKQNMCSNDKIL